MKEARCERPHTTQYIILLDEISYIDKPVETEVGEQGVTANDYVGFLVGEECCINT